MWCVGVNSFSYDGRIKLLVLFHISHVSLTVFIVLRTSRNFFFYLRNISEFILALSETKLNEALKHICLHNWAQPNQWIFIFKCCWAHLKPLNTKCRLSMEICNDNSIVLSLEHREREIGLQTGKLCFPSFSVLSIGIWPFVEVVEHIVACSSAVGLAMEIVVCRLPRIFSNNMDMYSVRHGRISIEIVENSLCFGWNPFHVLHQTRLYQCSTSHTIFDMFSYCRICALHVKLFWIRLGKTTMTWRAFCVYVQCLAPSDDKLINARRQHLSTISDN